MIAVWIIENVFMDAKFKNRVTKRFPEQEGPRSLQNNAGPCDGVSTVSSAIQMTIGSVDACLS